MKRLRLLLLAFCLISSFSTAQYTQTASYTPVDSVYWGNCGSVDCTTALPGHVDQISVSDDGLVLGINLSNHCLYSFNQSTVSWSQVGTSCIYQQVAAGSQNNVYALSTTPLGWGYQFGIVDMNTGTFTPYNNGNNWGFHQISAAGSSLWALGYSVGTGVYSIWHADMNTNPLNLINQAGGCSKVAARGGVNGQSSGAPGAFCLSGNSIWALHGENNTNTQMPGSATDIAVGGSVNTGQPFLYILGTGTTPQIFKWTGTAWRRFVVSGKVFTGIGAGGYGLVFPITNSTGNNVWHLKDQYLMATSATTGSYANFCAHHFPSGQCPIGSQHTVSTTAAFQGTGGLNGTAGVTGTVSGTPNSYMYASAREATTCDLSFGLGAAICLPKISGKALCTIMGALSVIPTIIQFQQGQIESCTAGYKRNGTQGLDDGWACGTDDGWDGGLWCNYNVSPWCANVTPPETPDYFIQYTRQLDTEGPKAWGFVGTTICIRPPFQAHWAHFDYKGAMVAVDHQFTPVQCTYHP